MREETLHFSRAFVLLRITAVEDSLQFTRFFIFEHVGVHSTFEHDQTGHDEAFLQRI